MPNYSICVGCGIQDMRMRNDRCSDCYRRLRHLRQVLGDFWCHIRDHYVPVITTRARRDAELDVRFCDGLDWAAKRDAPVGAEVERHHASRQTRSGNATLVAVGP